MQADASHLDESTNKKTGACFDWTNKGKLKQSIFFSPLSYSAKTIRTVEVERGSDIRKKEKLKVCETALPFIGGRSALKEKSTE